jgi:hypothetical protein
VPTSLSSFAETELKMRFREPFLTAGLNAKQAVQTAPGTYRGFRLAPHVATDTVTVVSDPDESDHVAVYQTLTGFSLTLRRTGGDFNLNLSTLVDAGEKTWVIAIIADYTVGSSTTAELRAYELSPADEFTGAGEKDELVVLGTVTIPAGGGVAIPDANIVGDLHNFAWEASAPDSLQWAPLIRNGDFDQSYEESEFTSPDYNGQAHFWSIRGSETDEEFKVVTTDPQTGIRHLAGLSNTGGPSFWSASQHVGVKVTPGQRIKLRFYKKNLVVKPSAQWIWLLRYLDAAGGLVDHYELIDDQTIDGSWVKTEKILEVPANAVILSYFAFQGGTPLLYDAASGDVIYFDNVQVWLETDADNIRDLYRNSITNASASGLTLVQSSLDGAGTNSGFYPHKKRGTTLDFTALETDADDGVVNLTPLEGNLNYPSPALGQGVTTTGGERTLMRVARVGTDASATDYREYVGADGRFEKVFNASYDNTTALWSQDSNVIESTRMTFGSAGLTLESKVRGAGAWADAAWDHTALDSKVSPPVGSGNETYAPLLLTRNSNQTPVEGFDHNGLLTGHHPRWTELWLEKDTSFDASPSTNLGKWVDDPGSAQTAGGGVLAISPISQVGAPVLDIAVDNSINAEYGIATKLPILEPFSDNLVCVLEFICDADTAGTLGGCDIFLGLVEDFGNVGVAGEGAYFRKLEANSFWEAVTINGGLTQTNTGVDTPGVSDNAQRFKIEWRGFDSPGGERVLFYINGALVGNHTTNITGADLRIVFRLDNKVASLREILMGPVYVTWSIVTPVEI